MRGKLNRKGMVFLAVLLLFSINAFAQAPKQKMFRSSQLAIAFPIPSNWTSEPCGGVGEPTKCVQFREGKSADPIVRVEAKGLDLESAIGEHILFERIDGKWHRTGRVGSSEAESISSNGWTGIYAIANCGITDSRSGFHPVAGDCLTAIISNGRRSVVLDTDGTVPADDILRHSIVHIRFLR